MLGGLLYFELECYVGPVQGRHIGIIQICGIDAGGSRIDRINQDQASHSDVGILSQATRDLQRYQAAKRPTYSNVSKFTPPLRQRLWLERALPPSRTFPRGTTDSIKPV